MSEDLKFKGDDHPFNQGANDVADPVVDAYFGIPRQQEANHDDARAVVRAATGEIGMYVDLDAGLRDLRERLSGRRR